MTLSSVSMNVFRLQLFEIYKVSGAPDISRPSVLYSPGCRAVALALHFLLREIERQGGREVWEGDNGFFWKNKLELAFFSLHLLISWSPVRCTSFHSRHYVFLSTKLNCNENSKTKKLAFN